MAATRPVPVPERLPMPQWLATGALIMTGSWDNTPIFHRRRGGRALSWAADYRKRYLPETARKLKELGIKPH